MHLQRLGSYTAAPRAPGGSTPPCQPLPGAILGRVQGAHEAVVRRRLGSNAHVCVARERRELESRIKRAVIMAQGRRITPTDLDLAGATEQVRPLSLKEARNETERRLLVEALSGIGATSAKRPKRSRLADQRSTSYWLSTRSEPRTTKAGGSPI
jgi:hypothetical protein